MLSILRSLELAEQNPSVDGVEAPPTQVSEVKSDEPKALIQPIVTQSEATQNTVSMAPARKYAPGEPYRKYVCSDPDRNLLLERGKNRELAWEIAQLVRLEGPIHDDLLTSRLKEELGIERGGSNVQTNIVDAIYQDIRAGVIERRRDSAFLWPAGKTLTTFRIPEAGLRRPLHMIHHDEISLAILYLVEDQFGMYLSEVPRAVGKLLGVERVVSEAADQILDIAEELVQSGSLRQSGLQVHIG